MVREELGIEIDILLVVNKKHQSYEKIFTFIIDRSGCIGWLFWLLAAETVESRAATGTSSDVARV